MRAWLGGACALAWACGTVPPAPPPAAEVAVDDIDVVFDADAIPALFTAVRQARVRIRGAPPAFGPRVAAAWEESIAEARRRGLDVEVGPGVEGGALAVLVADSTAILARCDIAEGGRGAALIVRGAAACRLEAPPPWRWRAQGIEILGDWPAHLEGPASVVVGAGEAPPAAVAALGRGSRVLAGRPVEIEAEVRIGPDPPGYAGTVVLAPDAAYLGLGPSVVRIEDPAVREALAAHFDEVLWPAGVPADSLPDDDMLPDLGEPAGADPRHAP